MIDIRNKKYNTMESNNVEFYRRNFQCIIVTKIIEIFIKVKIIRGKYRINIYMKHICGVCALLMVKLLKWKWVKLSKYEGRDFMISNKIRKDNIEDIMNLTDTQKHSIIFSPPKLNKSI